MPSYIVTRPTPVLVSVVVEASEDEACALARDAFAEEARRGSLRASLCRRDPFDAVQDARSEARYEDDPQAEPEQKPCDPGEVFACIVDESAGFRG
jgi:hypothetical protein